MMSNMKHKERWSIGGHGVSMDAEDDDDDEGQQSNSLSDPSSEPSSTGEGTMAGDPRLNGSVETFPDPLPIMPYWSAKRHLSCGNPSRSAASSHIRPWRGVTSGKLKTANAALVLCLNIDVDPPDVIKTNPCAVLECWVDPHTMPPNKALEAIGQNLQHQFEGLSLKIPYKPILDPSYEDLSRFCKTLRKQAKDDTVLFYYNGHGVPKPTPSGELWCFNRNYTQYIPVSLTEIQSWLGSPCVYVWDCSAAGNLLQNFINIAEKRDQAAHLKNPYGDGTQPFMNSLQLAACAANETLPSSPELPADVFTACLTSPIDMALRYFIMNHQLPNNITGDMVMQLPGDLKERRTPLGELNWIFTAITDAIAWTSFPREIFTRLYRSDLLIASLFRNFLLAERIMKNYHCTPHTYPPLPATNTHPMWAAWDLAVDTCLRQLPELLKINNEPSNGIPLPIAPSSPHLPAFPPVPSGLGTRTAGVYPPRRLANTARDKSTKNSSDSQYKYIPSRFFADQLTAFEVWISRGGSALTKRGPMSIPSSNIRFSDGDSAVPVEDSDLVPRKPPDQLPIVLQVLLSQPHRLRALILLSQFVDLGPWAVHLVLTVGIFPYISRLLLAAGQDLRPVLIFIWARILAVDPTVQLDLFNNQGYRYFASVLSVPEDTTNDPVLPNSSEHKAMCAFILSAVARDFKHGQDAVSREGVFDNCFERLDEGDFLLRQWCALCIGQIWDRNDEIKIYGVDRGTQDKLIALLSDDACEVRCAALFALGTFMGATGSLDPNKQGGGGSGQMYQLELRVHFRMEVAVATGATLAVRDDASPMVRKELLVLLSCLVKEWRGYFIVCAWIYWEEDCRRQAEEEGHFHQDITSQVISDWLSSFPDEDIREESRVLLSSLFTIFVFLLELSVDPYQEVATNAQTVVDYIMALLLESSFTSIRSHPFHHPLVPEDANKPNLPIRSRVSSLRGSPDIVQESKPLTNSISPRPVINRTETMSSTLSSGVENTIRRTASFANVIKNLAGGISFTTVDDGRSSPALAPAHLRDRVDISRPPSPNLNIAQYTSPYSRPPSPQLSPTHSPQSLHQFPEEKINQSSLNHRNSPLRVMQALIEEDMQRLHARRQSDTLPHMQPDHFSQRPGTVEKNPSEAALGTTPGLETGIGIRDVLPLKSTFFDWCVEYFKEPQMRQAEADEPGSLQYNYQVWRQRRNDTVSRETVLHAEIAHMHPWDRPVATIQTPSLPLLMSFHSFDHHVVISNETDMVTVYDWTTRKQISHFCNGNPKGSSITSLHFINEDVGGLILTGSADGVVRLFRNYDSTTASDPIQMVSAFRGLNELIPVKRGAGVVMDWKQTSGTLTIGGDSRIVRVWDAHTETQLSDLDTKSESPVTAITSDRISSSTFIASFSDGTVKMFDRRLEEDEAVVRSYSHHQSWVQNISWHATLGGQFLSGSLDGDIHLWDIRSHNDLPVQTWMPYASGLSSFAGHPQAPVFAATSAVHSSNPRNPKLLVQSLVDDRALSNLTFPTGQPVFTGRGHASAFIPRLGSLVFHPMEMLYGVGGMDGTIRVLGCNLS